MKWYTVKEREPKHYQTVLAHSKSGYCVCIYVHGEEVFKKLMMAGFPFPIAEIDRKKNQFCSQEIQGNVLNGVTHWMPLPDKPHD